VGFSHPGDGEPAAGGAPAAADAPERGAALELREVTKRFGGVVAVAGVSLRMASDELLAIIGPNGAGKSTLLSLMAGSQRPSSGEIWFAGRRIDRLSAYLAARLGIGRTFQTPRPFGRMSVRDNLRVAAAAPGPRSQRRLSVDEVLALTGLERVAGVRAGTLTLLELKRLELARGLARGPRLLLLDEIGAGLTRPELARLVELIAEIRRLGVALVVVEHVRDFVMEIADRVAVMDRGRIHALGPPQQVAEDPLVLDAYLGRRPAAGSEAARPARAPAPLPSPPRGASAPLPATERSSSPTVPPGSEAGGNEAGAALLRARGLSVDYGRVRAISGIDLEVRAGEAVAVLGPNGAGKSTLCRALLGLVPIRAGSVEAGGREITRWPTERRVREARVTMCPEGRRVFADQSVLENLRLGGVGARDAGGERLERVFELFPELAARKGQPAGTLSGGEQQMLAIGRGLMADPRVLIVDELSLGLAPEVAGRIYDRLRRMLERDLALVLVEQYVTEVLTTASRTLVLDRGVVAYRARSGEVPEGELARVYLRGQGDGG
jgi:branched-chain amino acid transport system ATP-binding protein